VGQLVQVARLVGDKEVDEAVPIDIVGLRRSEYVPANVGVVPGPDDLPFAVKSMKPSSFGKAQLVSAVAVHIDQGHLAYPVSCKAVSVQGRIAPFECAICPNAPEPLAVSPWSSKDDVINPISFDIPDRLACLVSTTT